MRQDWEFVNLSSENDDECSSSPLSIQPSGIRDDKSVNDQLGVLLLLLDLCAKLIEGASSFLF